MTSVAVMAAVVRKELAATWATPVPYVVGALFNAALGLLFVDQLQGRLQAVVQPLFPLAGFLLLVTVPLLTMRTVAEESRSGTLEVLLAIPVRGSVLVAGKWLASWVTAVAVVAPSGALAWLVALYGDPDAGPVVAGFVGVALLAAALVAGGVAASSWTSSQAVAGMVSFVVAAMLWFASSTTGVRSGATLARVSLADRLRSFAGGAIDGADVGYFVVVVVALLVVAAAGVALHRRALLAGLAVVLAVGGVAATDRVGAVADLTADRTLTLTDQTTELLARVHRPVTVTAFLTVDDPDRAQAAALLGRYRRVNRNVRYRFLDPARAAGELRRLGVDPALGGVAVEMGGSVDVVPTLTEQDVTGALARLLRGRSATVCVATGHGEASIDDTGAGGWSEAAALLRDNGYVVEPVDLPVAAAVPQGCTGVVVAGPASALGDGPARALSSWLGGDGRLLLLTDPANDVDVGALASPFGLGVRRGIVLEGDPSGALPDDPTAPIVRRFSSASPVVRRVPPSYFPGAQEVTVARDVDEGEVGAGGLTVNRLADTSPASYLETEPLGGSFDPSADVAGPITIAAAADRSRVVVGDGGDEGSSVVRSRIVVVGDVDFSTNAYLAQGGNSRLLVQAMDWLTLDDELVVLSAHLPRDRPLVLTPRRLAYARFMALGVIPGLFLLVGAAVGVVRRSR